MTPRQADKIIAAGKTVARIASPDLARFGSATMHYEPKHIKLWTMPQNYFGETWPAYYSAGVGQSRDSDCLERSNFACMLDAVGGESETVIVVRESHWAVGWIEWIAIHDDNDAALKIADDIQERLANYPVIDEMHWSDLEHEEASQVWANCYSWQDRIEYIRKNRSQFEFRDMADLLGCVRGQYFAGYASELIR